MGKDSSSLLYAILLLLDRMVGLGGGLESEDVQMEKKRKEDCPEGHSVICSERLRRCNYE